MNDIRTFLKKASDSKNETEINDPISETKSISIDNVNINIAQERIQPGAKGNRWTDEEESRLLDEIAQSIPVSTIALNHERTCGGITSRLREIAYKMMTGESPLGEVMKRTKLNEFQICEVMEQKAIYEKKRQEKKQESELRKKMNEQIKQENESNKHKAQSVDDTTDGNQINRNQTNDVPFDIYKHVSAKYTSSHVLSIEQECALQQFENGDNLFITGEGGTGKTLLIRDLVQSANHNGRKIQVCAMTGCAALLLNCNARTIHSWSGIKLGKGELNSIVESIIYNHVARNMWRSTDILIVDEVSMMSKRIFDILSHVGKKVRKCYDKPFGGLQLIFVGDFFQLPPVATNDALAGDESFCFESDEWLKTFPIDNHIVLKTMFRQDDEVFRRILGNVRMGIADPTDVAVLKKYLNRSFDYEKYQGVIPTKLFPTKYKVDKVNREMFDKLEGESYIFPFVSKTDCHEYIDGSDKTIPLPLLSKCRKNLNSKKTQYEIDSLANNTPCVKNLELKVGANVMCTVNLDMDRGICNGSIGKIVEFRVSGNDICPVVLFSNGYRMTMVQKFWQSEDYPTIAVGQFPLCLAWAMTIHKIQGATLSMAEIDIGGGIFECGQTYVALSRVKSLDGLYLSNFEPNKIKTNKKVKKSNNNINPLKCRLF